MLKPYEKYKDIDAPWLDVIPMNWQEKRIRELFGERKTKVSDKDFQPLSVCKKGVVPQLESAVKTDNGDNRKLVCKKDFVINSRSDRKGSSGISDYDGSVSLINIVLQPRKDINEKYFHYLLRSSLFIEEFYRNGRGIVSDLWTTRYSEMKNITVPFPTEVEQDKIVQYLEWKCLDIHKVIKAKKKLINYLKEQRDTIICEFVTGSNDNEQEYKDSNNKWIGRIPSVWRIERFSNLFVLGKGLNITKEDLRTTGIKCISYGEIHSKFGFEFDPLKNELKCVDEKYKLVKSQSLLNIGDFVFADTSEDIIGAGNFSYLSSNSEVFAGYHTIIARLCDVSVLPRYVAYFFESLVFRNQIRSQVNGVKVYSISRTILKSTSIAFPGIKKQKRIIELLDFKCGKIDFIMSKIKNEIQLLEEYRKRLISDVVTGKVDIRDVIIPSFEQGTDESEEEFEAETDDVEEMEEEVDADE